MTMTMTVLEARALAEKVRQVYPDAQVKRYKSDAPAEVVGFHWAYRVEARLYEIPLAFYSPDDWARHEKNTRRQETPA